MKLFPPLLLFALLTGCSSNNASYTASDLINCKYDSTLMAECGYSDLIGTDLAPYVTCLLKGNGDLLKTIDYCSIDTSNLVICYAFVNHDIRLVKKLLELGCSTNIHIDEYDEFGDFNPTLLNYMSYDDTLSNEEFECIKMVVEKGVDLNHIAGLSDRTPLMYCIQFFHEGGRELAKYLIEHGADVNYCFHSRQYSFMNYPCYALKLAFDYERNDLIELFLEYGACAQNEKDYNYMLDYINNMNDTVLSSKFKESLELMYPQEETIP